MEPAAACWTGFAENVKASNKKGYFTKEPEKAVFSCESLQ